MPTQKHDPAPEVFLSATLRWVEMTVALTMVHRGEALSHEDRRAKTEEIVARWRGNRGPDWKPTVADVDALVESTLRWANGRVRPMFEGWNT